MTPPTYWRMRLTEVKDYVMAYDSRHTVIEADLTDSIQTEQPVGSGRFAQPSLPRAGDFYWLIDDDTFKTLVRDAI